MGQKSAVPILHRCGRFKIHAQPATLANGKKSSVIIAQSLEKQILRTKKKVVLQSRCTLCPLI